MQIPVLIESVAGNGFRAQTGAPLTMSAEGTTADEALQRLHEMVNQRLAQGARLVSLGVPDEANPWVQFAGMFKDDPIFEEVCEIMAEQRRQVEEDPNYL
jgi:hypothetical protein